MMENFKFLQTYHFFSIAKTKKIYLQTLYKYIYDISLMRITNIMHSFFGLKNHFKIGCGVIV